MVQRKPAEGTNIPSSLLRYWRNKYLAQGKSGLEDSYYHIDPQLKVIKEENARLKKIIGRQVFELEVKDEILKSHMPTCRKESDRDKFQRDSTSKRSLCVGGFNKE
jgi:hypothetical protein